jgi:hypothetical protein
MGVGDIGEVSNQLGQGRNSPIGRECWNDGREQDASVDTGQRSGERTAHPEHGGYGIDFCYAAGCQSWVVGVQRAEPVGSDGMRSHGLAIRDSGALPDRAREAPDKEGDNNRGRKGRKHECRLVNGRGQREPSGSEKSGRDGEHDGDSAWLRSGARRIFRQGADRAHRKRGDEMGV